MTTVTGLTADRMLAIEAASVVDGDVDGNGNLILTKHDGSKINAGSVIGPVGPAGPVGQDKSVLASRAILDVGLANQIRAGRQLSPADFGNLGLNAPIGLWNLSDLTDVSGNGRNLQNKGAIPFAAGINGVANTAAQFVGNTGQVLYISDTGANDPFRIKIGCMGCWFKVAKRGIVSELITKRGYSAGQYVYGLEINGNNVITLWVSGDGTATPIATGISDICDDKWHFVVGVYDGTYIRLYVDGVLEAATQTTFGVIIPTIAMPFNIGGGMGDASTACQNPFFGRIDEAFITADIPTDDQIRNLYCAKIAHTLGAAPIRVSLNVRRRRKGAAFTAADFPTQPLRLYNFSGGSGGDEGSHNIPLTSPGRMGINMAPGPDGTANNSYFFNGNAGTDFQAADTGLPSAVATPRSYGCWVKASSGADQNIMSWGQPVTTADVRLFTAANNLVASNGSDQLTGPFIRDGQWHFVVITEDNAAIDGVKRKMYVDGKLFGNSITMNPATLSGANGFRIGSNSTGGAPLIGYVDGVFICDYALTAMQIASLYAKGSQALTPSPKNSGDHIEAMDATSLYATFDTLESQHQVDLAVA